MNEEWFHCEICGWPYRSEAAADACCQDEYDED